MRHRRLLVSVGLVVAFVTLVLAGLTVAVKRVPAFYAQADQPAGPERHSASTEATGQYLRMANAIQNLDPEWKAEFTADQLNAYFQDDFVENHGGDANLPDGFSTPRVQIQDGRLRLGARYGTGFGSTVVSIQVRVWLVPGQANALAMEIVSLKAGALPLSSATLLDKISTTARHQNIDVTWFRENDHPVAILRFQSDLTRPTLLFDRVDLADGKLTIQGRSADPFAGQRKN